MKKPQLGSSRDPENVALVLHYANADATEATWRGIVLGPAAASGQPFSNATPFGVQSLVEFLTIQEALRTCLDRLVALDSAYAEDARRLAREITEEARPKFQGWAFSPVDQRLFERWETETSSFREAVFLRLAYSLQEISFRDLYRCESCGKFFADTSSRERKFCSNRCRSRATVRRHRGRSAGTLKQLPTKATKPPR